MKRVPRTALMREAGPYEVKSRADGVLLVLPQRPDTDLVSRTTLATDIAALLNAPYPEEKP